MKPSDIIAYRRKLCSAEKAVQCVKSGDTVYLGSTSSLAYKLCEALEAREHELENVCVCCSQFRRVSKLFSPEASHAFTCCSYFLSSGERNSLLSGNGSFTSVHLSQIEIWCKETARPNVAFLEVSTCDENGFMSFGATGVALHGCISRTADIIVLQVNPKVPYVYGEDNLIHYTQADYIVEAEDELETIADLKTDEVVKTISKSIIELIPDGATIQLGLGGIAGAVGYGLREKNDLGVHSEMVGDVIMHLMQEGVVNNRYKTFLPGKSVAGFAFGSKELYRFLNHNEKMYFMPFSKVNDPSLIAQNDRMISINTAMSIDLFGQVASEALGYRQYSGTGGQLDFVRGAQNAREGKSFFAISSTVNNSKAGRISRIVSSFAPGTVVTTPRSDVQYVATEYGCVNLKPLCMRDRILAMISLAHPDFREQLYEEAKQAKIL